MVFNTGAALLDAIVLAVVSHDAEGTYGYKITQDVRQAIDISESTLYPVLRRLQKDGCLETYDMEYAGEKPQVLPDYGRGNSPAQFVHERVENLFIKDIEIVRGE